MELGLPLTRRLGRGSDAGAFGCALLRADEFGLCSSGSPYGPTGQFRMSRSLSGPVEADVASYRGR
jgi:hypothetical protein